MYHQYHDVDIDFMKHYIIVFYFYVNDSVELQILGHSGQGLKQSTMTRLIPYWNTAQKSPFQQTKHMIALYISNIFTNVLNRLKQKRAKNQFFVQCFLCKMHLSINVSSKKLCLSGQSVWLKYMLILYVHVRTYCAQKRIQYFLYSANI